MQNAYLVGTKVYLRPLEPADAPTLKSWMNDPDVRRTLGVYRPQTEQSERDFIEKISRTPEEIGFGIVTRRDDRFIGTAGLMRIDWRVRRAGFGISIGDKTRWGSGYGTEVTRLVTDYAFETLNLNRVWLEVYDFNPAGIRVYERVGYRREGVQREDTFHAGEYRDVLRMAVLRAEWQAARAGRRTAAAGARAGRAPSPARARRGR